MYLNEHSRPQSPMVDTEIDAGILKFVNALRTNLYIETLGSCDGFSHQKGEPYVDIAVHKKGLNLFIEAINFANRKLSMTSWGIEVILNYDEKVVTAYDPNYPDWINFEIIIHNYSATTDTPVILDKIARDFSTFMKRKRFPSNPT